jgi:hypothetical protein
MERQFHIFGRPSLPPGGLKAEIGQVGGYQVKQSAMVIQPMRHCF